MSWWYQVEDSMSWGARDGASSSEVGQDILPAVIIICRGSFRLWKDSCGDLDTVITHPDGTSHRCFFIIIFKIKICKVFKGYEVLKRGFGFQYSQ